MARQREFDTDEILMTMAERFWTNGYEATGISDLEDTTGLGRASLYGAFGTKREMLLKSLDVYMTERIEKMIAPLLDGGIQAIEDLFRRFAVTRETMPDRAVMGCFMVNTSTELAASDQEVARKSAEYQARFRGAFLGALARGVDEGEILGPIEDRADQLTLMMLGLFVAIRSAASLDEIRRLTEAVVAQVASWRLEAANA